MTMKKSKKVWRLLLVLSLVIGMAAGGVQSQAYSVPSNMKWWTKDRFGMFIHFGAYSYYGHGEWAMQTEGISKQKYQSYYFAFIIPIFFSLSTTTKGLCAKSCLEADFLKLCEAVTVKPLVTRYTTHKSTAAEY